MEGTALKERVQRLALLTQFAPFTWLYRGLYALAVRLCVRALRRIPGVLSIYLRRGLASGRPVYGLSDIDLAVIVADEGGARASSRVRYGGEALWGIVPMLAEGELGVYSLGQFRRLYERSPFYRSRILRGRREWRLLHGADVLADLPAAGRGEEARLAVEELRPAWRCLSQELLPRDGRPAYARHYVAYKALAEAARAALVSDGLPASLSRDEAIRRAGELWPQVAGPLREVAACRENLLAARPLATDGLLASYVFLAGTALGRPPADSDARLDLSILPPEPAALQALPGGPALRTMSEGVEALDGIDRAVLVPRLRLHSVGALGLDPREFAGATVDAFDLVLVGRRLPPAAGLRALNRSLAPLWPAVCPYFCDGRVAVALRPVQDGGVRDPARDPAFFACLATGRSLEGKLEASSRADVRVPVDSDDALRERALSLLGLFAERDVYRMSPRSFLALFWEACRAAWMALQPGGGSVPVPTSSEDVLERVAALTPAAAPLLRRLRGEPSEAARLTAAAVEYAGGLERLVRGERADVPVPPDEAGRSLSISVVIPTRNRARLLDRALRSLAAQQRLPDQVVVVDNGSTDDTARVARSFDGSLNLTLVREETVGIPHARNAGLRHCRGDVVAFIDDDCVAHADWLLEIEKPFLRDPRLGAVGGRLLPLERGDGPVAHFYDERMRGAAPSVGGQEA